MPANELPLRVYFMERFDCKVIYQKCVFKKYWKPKLIKIKKTYCQLCIDYELNKYIWKIFKKFKVFFIPVAIESLLYLHHPTLSSSKSTCSIVPCPSFQFHNNNSIPISISEHVITLLPNSEMRKFQALAFCQLTF